VVNEGLQAFDRNQYKKALEAFNTAEGMNPTEMELQAITYNRACAHTKLGDLPAACEDLKRAVNDYGVKYSTVVKDNDFQALRDSPLFDDISNELKGASTESQLAKFRTEAKAPFRTFRLLLAGGFSIASGLALFTTLPALLRAVADQNQESINTNVTNLVVNAGVLALCALLINRDLSSGKKDLATQERLEALGKLQVQRDGKQVALSRLRGTKRVVIVAGSGSHVRSAVREAQSYKNELGPRAVTVVPVVLDVGELMASKAKLEALKKGFGNGGDSAADGAAPDVVGGAAPAAEVRLAKELRLDPVDPESWQKWVDEQMALADVKPGSNVHITLGLDGSVYSSGVGAPKWSKMLLDLEPLDSTKTKLTNV